MEEVTLLGAWEKELKPSMLWFVLASEYGVKISREDFIREWNISHNTTNVKSSKDL